MATERPTRGGRSSGTTAAAATSVVARDRRQPDPVQPAPPGPPPGRARWAAGLARRHAGLLVLLAVAAAARAVVTAAYATALWFPDSGTYVSGAAHVQLAVDRPWAYSAFLRLVLHFVSFRSVAVVQHLLGLVTVVLVYGLLQRRGVSRWAGLLAVLPLALDAYVLDIEQFLLAEGLFLFLLAVVVVALLARERPGGLVLGGVGVLAGVLSLTRTTGLAVAGVVLLYLLVRLLLRTLRWTAVAGFVLGLAATLLPYAAWFDSQHGSFALTDYTGHFLYGRVADFVRCDEIDVPTRLRALCPPGEPGQRPTADHFVWAGDSPANLPPDGAPAWTEHDLEQFARAAIEAQPGDYATRVLGETAHYFSPGRSSGPQDTCPLWWQFPVPTATAPSTCIAVLAPGPHAWRPALVADLRGYQRVVYTPGPVLALCAVAGLAALFRRRWAPRERLDPALLVVLGLSLLLVPAATASFDWRYLLPTLVVLPPAAALALRGPFRRDRRPGAAP